MALKEYLLDIVKLKYALLYFVAVAVSSIVGIVINPLLAIGLNHEDYAVIGYYASFQSLLIPIISLSLHSYYSRNYFLLEDDARQTLLQNIMSVFSTLGAVMFVLFVLLYYVYHRHFCPSIPFSPYAIISFLPAWFSAFYNLYLLDLRMKGDANKYSKIVILNSIFNALLSVLLVYIIRYGAIGRLIAMLIVSVLFYFYVIDRCRYRFQWNWDIIKPAVKFCLPIMISGILSFFFIGIDRPMLAGFNDNYTLGLYNVGLQISSYLAIFGTVLIQTFDPDIYKYTSLNQHKNVLLLVLGVVVASLIPNLCFMVVSKPLIGLLTAGRYVDASLYANILCLKNVTTTFAFVMSGVLIGYGCPKYELFNRVVGSVFALLLYKILIGNYGFYGAAWGQSLSWLIMGLISCFSLFIFMKYGKSKT